MRSTLHLEMDQQDRNLALTAGEYTGVSWSEGNVHNKALVLWDLDQGSWGKSKLITWISGIEKIVREQFKVERFCHFGALNTNVPNRHNWRTIT